MVYPDLNTYIMLHVWLVKERNILINSTKTYTKIYMFCVCVLKCVVCVCVCFQNSTLLHHMDSPMMSVESISLHVITFIMNIARDQVNDYASAL